MWRPGQRWVSIREAVGPGHKPCRGERLLARWLEAYTRLLVALLLCGTAARGEELQQPLIARPITMPAGRVDLTLHGTYTNWAGAVLSDELPGTTLTGETLSLGVDFGVRDKVQLGLAVALPIHPGAGFGTVVGSAAIAGEGSYGGRLDFGYERTGLNGDVPQGGGHNDRFFGGVGFFVKAPINSMIAFVSGRVGAVQFGQYRNVGLGAPGLYVGASSFYTDMSSDLLTISGGDNIYHFGFNFPLGLLVQANQRLAITLHTGYSLELEATSGRTLALHFVPVGIEVVVTPASPVDVGVRFFIDGYVGGDLSMEFVDMRGLMTWLRYRL